MPSACSPSLRAYKLGVAGSKAGLALPQKKIEGASGLGKRVWRKTKAFVALAPAKLPAKKKRDHADAHFITETTRGQTSVAFGPRGVVSARARGFGWPSP